MPTVSIDNIEYELDSLSTDAKNQFASLQFVDQKLAQLEAEIAVFKTARIGYSKALKEALPDVSKDKKSKH
jgi:hypothetical protein